MKIIITSKTEEGDKAIRELISQNSLKAKLLGTKKIIQEDPLVLEIKLRKIMKNIKQIFQTPMGKQQLGFSINQMMEIDESNYSYEVE